MSDSVRTDKFNRVTGLVVLEVRNSNPNGDPDLESDPRTLDADGRGVISPVSFKRKLRDLVHQKEGPVWEHWAKSVEWKSGAPDWADDLGYRYEILETRGRNRDEIKKLNAEDFKKRYWDARVFGNTFLESMKKEEAKEDLSHFITTGVVQIGVGISVAPVEIDRWTQTNKAGVQEGKDRGMAPLGFRVIRHGVYAIPFFVNPSVAIKTGLTKRDLDLLRFLMPHAYSHTASASRPFVSLLHAWWVEHKNALGSCPDSLLIDALMPRRADGEGKLLGRLEDYLIPSGVPDDLSVRIQSIIDVTADQTA